MLCCGVLSCSLLEGDEVEFKVCVDLSSHKRRAVQVALIQPHSSRAQGIVESFHADSGLLETTLGASLTFAAGDILDPSFKVSLSLSPHTHWAAICASN